MAAVATFTECVICERRPGAFRHHVCRECRQAAARLILEGDFQTDRELWTVGDAIEAVRMKFEQYRNERASAPPEAEVLASVAQGLLEQGMHAEALLNAAGAILLGESADANTVGASALSVVLDPRIARGDIRKCLSAELARVSR